MNSERDYLRRSRRGLTYQRSGSGSPIVLVHGWCLNRTVWLYQEQALVTAGFDVIAVDLAGYGDSARLVAPTDLAEHGGDLADLLDELSLDGVTVVGFAFGAAVLMHLPDFTRVATAVAIGVPSAAGAPYSKMKSAMLRDWPVFAQRSAAAICAREHSPAALAWLGNVFASTPLPSALAGVDILAAFEPLRVAQRWTVPFVFVHGADDTVVDPRVSADCAAQFHGASTVVIPDSGHFVPWDRPQELSTLLQTIARGLA